MLIKKLSSFFLFPFFIIFLTACQKDPTPDHQTSTLRMSMETEPQSIDPRRVRDLSNVTLIHMLYEGLLRIQEDSQPGPALAEKVSVSPDQKTYTFKLRPSHWTDGTPLTAHDFEETWKGLLDPQFPSPNAYQLYVIRGAKAAKEGLSNAAEIGIHAEDDHTLIVQLERPVPYFLHLVASYFYYPVHPTVRKIGSDFGSLKEEEIPTNGPFQLDKWSRRNELITRANSRYWNKENVHLEKIIFVILDNPTALQLYQKNELDWTGSPLSTLPIDALPKLKKEGQLHAKASAGIYLFRVNTESPPFTDPKMRQAFAWALNRKDLVQHVLQGNQIPATGIVPSSFIDGKPFFEDNDVSGAREFFKEALEEQGLTLENFPSVTIHYASGERAHKVAQVAQQQWKEALGVNVKLQSMESKVYFDQIKNHNYQLGIGSWFADIKEPLSFLEIFKSKENGTNNTQWENQEYITLLDQSYQTFSDEERHAILKKAEGVLIQEMPVIPLFYNSYNYVKNPRLKGVYFSELGYLDFKNAYFENSEDSNL